jgi:hypothetical protein
LQQQFLLKPDQQSHFPISQTVKDYHRVVLQSDAPTGRRGAKALGRGESVYGPHSRHLRHSFDPFGRMLDPEHAAPVASSATLEAVSPLLPAEQEKVYFFSFPSLIRRRPSYHIKGADEKRSSLSGVV